MTLDFRNGTKLHLLWGVELEIPESRQFRVAYRVPPATQVQVNLSATRVLQKWEYRATLATKFEDGTLQMRPVRGVFQVR